MVKFKDAPVAYAACAGLWSASLASPAGASEYALLDAGVQARFGQQTVMGADSPESFFASDLRAAFTTPYEYRFDKGARLGARVLTSVGLFRGPDKTAIVASAVPLLALSTADQRFSVDGGMGLALLSEHQYRDQDFGGPLQFALTVGLGAPLYKRLGVSYRFMHYSDGGVYGPHTIGADLHMAGLAYRF